MKKTENKRMTPAREKMYRFFKNRLSVVGLVLLAIILVFCLFAEVIVPYEIVVKQDIRNRQQEPSAEHIMGTDGYGRDVFSRIVHGTRYTMAISVPSSILAAVVGTILGALVSMFPKLDNPLMRVLDVFQALPNQVMAMAVVAALGPSLLNLVVALIISNVPAGTRNARSVMLTLANSDYIESARSYGTSSLQNIFRHIIPNALGPIIVNTTINLAAITLAASSLSYLGLGVQPPTPEWGALLSEAREYMITEPSLIIFPGIALLLAALGFNLVGDGLRDALDPRLID